MSLAHPNPLLKRRITALQWALPVTLVVLVFVYQLGLARWVHNRYNEPVHFAIEIGFYATVGPALTFWTLVLIRHWLEEKEHAEQTAINKDRLLAAVTNASADAILSLDPSGRIESWNRGAELLFRFPAEEIIGQPFVRLMGGSESAAVDYDWLMETTREAGFVREHETRCTRADGRTVHVEITATIIQDEQDQPIGTSLILRDITSRKKREAEIKRLNEHLNSQVHSRTRELAEKVAALAQANDELQKLDQTRSEFVSLVSHQIRAPLTNVLGAVERMQSDCATVSPTCSRMFTILDMQVGRLDRLVNDVLQTARIETGDLSISLEPVSILPILKDAAAQISTRTDRRQVQVQEKPGLPLVFADRDRILEVLANLLDNAEKYAPANADIDLTASADQDHVTISVRDHGPGLPEKDLERIFEKFYRTDGGDSQAAYGYGLGLYLCRRLVEAQNGQIWADNHPQGGAVFSFTLPVWTG